MSSFKKILKSSTIGITQKNNNKKELFDQKAINKINGTNEAIKKDESIIPYDNIDKDSSQRFLQDKEYRKEKCDKYEVMYIYNYLRDLYNKIINCNQYSDIEIILSENIEAITDIINSFGFIASVLDKILCYVLKQSFEIGNTLTCFNNYRNTRLINKIENNLNVYKNNGPLLANQTPINDIFEFIKYLALSNELFDEEHLNYLFYEMSKIPIEDYNPSLNEYWTLILIKYTNLLAKDMNIKNLIVFSDNQKILPDDNNIGFTVRLTINNQEYYGINIVYSNIKNWIINIGTIAHELEHVRLFELKENSFEGFLIKMENIMDYAIDEKDLDSYFEDNYRRRYNEIFAYQRGYEQEKKLIEQSAVIDLDILDSIEKKLENNGKYMNVKTKRVGNNVYHNFTLFRYALKKYKLYLMEKYGENYKEKMRFSSQVRLLLDDNYEILSYEEIVKKNKLNECYLATFKDDELAKTRKNIYEWALSNYTSKKEKSIKSTGIKR